VVEPGGDRHLARERAGKLPAFGARRGLDRRMKEEQSVTGRWGMSAEVLEERAFRAEDLHGAGRETGEPVEAPRLGH